MTARTLLSSAVSALEKKEFSYAQSVGVIATAVYLRTFLENFTNANNAGALNGFLDTFFHYPLWFGCVFLSGMLILSTVGKVPAKIARSVVALCSFIILLPPAIDILAYGFAGQPYSFVVGDSATMLFHFFTLLLFTGAIGIGIKTEILLALGAVFLYIRTRTGSLARGALGALLLYIAIFLFLGLPAFASALAGIHTGASGTTVAQFFFEAEPSASHYWPRPILIDERSAVGLVGTSAADHFSVSMAALLLLSFAALLAALYRNAAAAKWGTILKNLRLSRIAHYFLMALLGLLLAFQARGADALPATLGDWLALFLLFAGILFAWLFAVWENDDEDRAIDRISNKERPLAEHRFTALEWLELKWTFFALALASALLAGWYPFAFLSLFLLSYHAYSCAPLRLKRVPVLSSMLVGANALLVAMAAFFLAAGTQALAAFPAHAAAGLFTIFVLAENVKNVKDIEGDRAAGIRTLPAALGGGRGKLATAALTALSALLVPVFFGMSPYTLALALLASAVLFFLVARPHFRELPVFLAYFAYAAAFVLLSLSGLA